MEKYYVDKKEFSPVSSAFLMMTITDDKEVVFSYYQKTTRHGSRPEDIRKRFSLPEPPPQALIDEIIRRKTWVAPKSIALTKFCESLWKQV